MRRVARRRYLAAICGAAVGLAGCGELSATELGGTPSETATPAPVPTDGAAGRSGLAAVETVVAFDDLAPNGLAVDGDGAVYVSAAISGQVRALPADRTAETGLSPAATERVATLDPRDGFLHAIDVHDGALYAALSSHQPETHGIWRVPLSGHTEPTRLAAFDPGLRLRNVSVDGIRGRLLVAHDRRGAVSTVGLDDGATATWLDQELLDASNRGATGLATGSGGAVLVTNYEHGRIVRVPVADDGSAGEPAVAVEDGAALSGAAGIARAGETLYVAARNLNRVVQISPSGSVEALAPASDEFDLPTDLALVEGGERTFLFVVNFGFEPMVGLTGDPSLVRLEL